MPGSVTEALRAAQAAAAKRDFGKAAAAYRAALAADANNIEAHVGLTKSLMRMHDRQATVEAARAFAACAPRRPSAKRLLGRALYEAGELDAAEAALSELTYHGKNDPEARLYLARIVLKKGLPERALEHLDAMTDKGRVAAQRHLLRGDALAQLSRLREAGEAYETARRLDPERIDILRQLTDVYDKLGPSSEAEQALRDLVARRPADAPVALRLARLLLQRRMLGEAEELVAKVLERTPDHRGALEVWASILTARRRFKLASAATPSPNDAAVLGRMESEGDPIGLNAYDRRTGGAQPVEREILPLLQNGKPGETSRDTDFGVRVRSEPAASRYSDTAARVRAEIFAEMPQVGLGLKGSLEAPQAEPTSEPNHVGSVAWTAEQSAAAIFAYRKNDFTATVDIVSHIANCGVANASILEIGGYAANRTGKWETAARFWFSLSRLQPKRRGPHLQYATALLEQGKASDALKVVDRLLAEDPNSTELIRAKLTVVMRAQDRAALDQFEAELAGRSWNRSDAALLENIGAAFLAVGAVPAARRWLERSLALDPGHHASLRLQARIAYDDREYREAIRLCEELEKVGTRAQRIEAHLIRARIAHLQSDTATAMAHYNSVAAEAPENIEAVTYLVRRHLAAREIEKAEARIAAVPVAGNEGSHHWWRAMMLQANREGERAVEELRTALEARSTDTQFRLRVVEFMLESDRLDAALDVIRRGLEIEPDSMRLRVRLLQCRIRMNCPPAEIVDIATDTLALNPHDEDALLQRGNAFNRIGRRREAIADFRTGAAAFPRNTTFWRSVIASLLVLGEEVEARKVLDEAKAAFAAKTASDLAALADIFDAADLPDQALAYAEGALAIDPEAQHTRQLLARIQVQRGRFDHAWPHLIHLQGSEHRHIRITRLFAQAAAGRMAANDGFSADADRLFPDVLFQAIVNRRPDRPAAPAWDDKPQLRVMHVTSSLGPGGAERQLANTLLRMTHLRNAGIEAELAVEDLNPAHGRDFFLKPIRETGIPVYSLDDERQAGNWRDMLAKHPETRDAVRAIATMPTEVMRNALFLLPLLLERHPDVVHLWQDSVCIASGIAAVLAGVPRIVLSTRSTRPIERQRARRYIEPGFRALLRHSGVSLINNSRNGARDYEDWLNLAPQTVTTIYNGYDFTAIRGRIDDTRSCEIRTELGIPVEAPLVGGVMRCSFEKRPELWTEAVIEVCRMMPDAYGILVGDGPMLGEIKARVAECGLGDRIRYVGNQSPVEPWMRAMSVLFLSSLTEGLPNVLIEAQSLGVPVATMRIGGAPETVIENETAIVIDNGPIESIAAALARLLADHERRKAYGRRAAEWAASEFSIEATVEKLIQFYGEARPNMQSANS